MSTNNLSQDEFQQLDQAEQHEMSQYLQRDLMHVLKNHEEIRPHELMGMRWVVTVQQFAQKKVKTMFVIMEYQATDYWEDELLQAATPTPTLRAKHSVASGGTTASSSINADVPGTFLQGKADTCVILVSELADALGITTRSLVRLWKADTVK